MLSSASTLRPHCPGGIPVWNCNICETDFINTIGISMLLSIIEKLKDEGGTLCFTNLSKAYHDVFEMIGLTRYIHIFPDEKEALLYLNDTKTL